MRRETHGIFNHPTSAKLHRFHPPFFLLHVTLHFEGEFETEIEFGFEFEFAF